MSLLTVSGFHDHNGAGLVNRNAASTARGAPPFEAPAASDWMLCPVCQIMRLGAARPALMSASPHPVTYCFFAVSRVPVYFLSRRPAAIYGRAPPLC
ncbi:MAG TPA: hypothetical protein VI455_05655 [Terriglobia bacterium]